MITRPSKLVGRLVMAAGIMILSSCGGSTPTGTGGGGGSSGGVGGGAGGGTDNLTQIGTYIRGLQYNPDQLLGVQSRDDGAELATGMPVGSPTTTNETAGSGNKVCTRQTYNLQRNFDQVAVLRPADDAIWPGALVKGDGSMIDGVPTPITLARAPVTFRIDLPGFTGGNGSRTVSNPRRSSVQDAIDDALEWWNANAFQAGYRNAASSSLRITNSYSSEQTGLKLGASVGWGDSDAKGMFQRSTSSATSVVVGMFKQVFYNVRFNAPASPQAVFDSAVTLQQAKTAFDASSPPAYVSSVAYGRIIMVRMETSYSTSQDTIWAAFKYASGELTATGSVETKYQQVLANSSFEGLVLGGSAGATALVFSNTQTGFGGMLDAIKAYSFYDRGNPGVPIAYTVKYLADNTVAKLGFTTDYTTTECLLNGDEIVVRFDSVEAINDCRSAPGVFAWDLGVAIDGSQTTDVFARVDKNSPIQIDDLAASNVHRIDQAKRYAVQRVPGVQLEVRAGVHVKGNITSWFDNWLTGSRVIYRWDGSADDGVSFVLGSFFFENKGSTDGIPCWLKVHYTVSRQ